MLAKASLQKIQQIIPGCTVFSDYLGLQTTSGSYEKRKQVFDFIDDSRTKEFLRDHGKPMWGNLTSLLEAKGFLINRDGVITVKLTADKKQNR